MCLGMLKTVMFAKILKYRNFGTSKFYEINSYSQGIR